MIHHMKPSISPRCLSSDLDHLGFGWYTFWSTRYYKYCTWAKCQAPSANVLFKKRRRMFGIHFNVSLCHFCPITVFCLFVCLIHLHLLAWKKIKWKYFVKLSGIHILNHIQCLSPPHEFNYSTRLQTLLIIFLILSHHIMQDYNCRICLNFQCQSI